METQKTIATSASTASATVQKDHKPMQIAGATLHLGDCLEVMRTLPDNSVDSIVTDPPYGLNFMGKKWDYDVPSVDVWIEALRILKPGGHLLAFAGTRTQHRMAARIEDAGFEIRDMIAWVYGSGFPKSLDVSKAIDKAAGAVREVTGPMAFSAKRKNPNKGMFTTGNPNGMETTPATEVARQWQGWGTALKPALEPITLARKPFTCTVADNVLTHGTGTLNIDGCRVERDVPRPNREPAIPLSGDGKKVYGNFAKEGSRAIEDTMQGRWPANLIHDASADVLAGFPDSRSSCGGGHGAGGNGEKSDSYSGGFRKDYDTSLMQYFDTGSASRFFYSAKASADDRNEGLHSFPTKPAGAMTGNMDASRKHSDGTPIAAVTRQNHHPTVKPTDLMHYLLRLVTPPGGIALDPYMGSGSTGKAAALGNFKFIGIERDPDYFAIACARLEYASAQGHLFTALG